MLRASAGFFNSIIEILCYDSRDMDRSQISFPTSEMLAPIARQFGLRLIVLFGSVARRVANSESDVDLGILANRPLNFDERLEIWSMLSPLFSAEVDLAVLDHASPILKFEVAAHGKVLFEKSPLSWENWKSYAFRQYWDTEKFRDDIRRYVARSAEEMRHAAVK